MDSPDTDPPIFSAVAQFVDGPGNPATLDGDATVESDRPDLWAVSNVAQLGGGKVGFDVTRQGPLGAANIKIAGDADLGSGVVPVEILGVLNNTATQAVGGSIDFGTPHA